MLQVQQKEITDVFRNELLSKLSPNVPSTSTEHKTSSPALDVTSKFLKPTTGSEIRYDNTEVNNSPKTTKIESQIILTSSTPSTDIRGEAVSQSTKLDALPQSFSVNVDLNSSPKTIKVEDQIITSSVPSSSSVGGEATWVHPKSDVVVTQSSKSEPEINNRDNLGTNSFPKITKIESPTTVLIPTGTENLGANKS